MVWDSIAHLMEQFTDQTCLKEIFVKPASGDAGTAYGAALLGAGKK